MVVKMAENEKDPKIFWGSASKMNSGNAYGYFVHNQMLKEYIGRIVPLYEHKDAKNAIIIVSPEFYINKTPDVANFLFTMFEGTTLPKIYADSIQKADFLLTPSTWVKERFSAYYPSERTFVVNHGVSPDFTYKKRKYPHKKPFRFLWIGAPNPRKGFEEVSVIWKHGGLFNNPRFELYLKTTNLNTLQTRGNVILDGRNLSKKELIALYHSAHCFLFPTRGEGFGLTLAEAMKTGLPCISPYYSGVTDFFDGIVGYVVDHKLGGGTIEFRGTGMKEDTTICYPNVDEIANAMWEIFNNYREALEKGRRASVRIASRFTWERSAQTLVDIIREYGG